MFCGGWVSEHCGCVSTTVVGLSAAIVVRFCVILQIVVEFSLHDLILIMSSTLLRSCVFLDLVSPERGALSSLSTLNCMARNGL